MPGLLHLVNHPYRFQIELPGILQRRLASAFSRADQLFSCGNLKEGFGQEGAEEGQIVGGEAYSAAIDPFPQRESVFDQAK